MTTLQNKTNANVLGGNVPSIVEPLPFGLIPYPAQATQLYQRTGINFDWAVGGIPFIAGESLRGSYFRRQFLIDFAQMKKDQFDAQPSPGEQSMNQWWLRSQSTFTSGAGIEFSDYNLDTLLVTRYWYSEHVDTMSNVGQTYLLPATKNIYSSANTNLRCVGVNVSGTDYVLICDGTAMKLVTYAGVVTTLTTSVNSATIVSIATDGTNYYFASSTGIYSGPLNNGTAATKIWNVPSSSGNNVLGWVKGRLCAGLDNSFYELVGNLGPTLPVPKFSHFNSAWTFTAIAESPAVIYAAGSAAATGGVYSFGLQSDGTIPVLTAGSIAAQLPTGEVPTAMFAYLGSFLGIGTSKGMRVAAVDTTGNISYGPLLWKGAAAVNAITGYDRFLYAGNTNNQQSYFMPPAGEVIQSTSGIMRVDLSTVTSTGAQPYANDLDSHVTGTVSSATLFGNGTAANGLSNVQGVVAFTVSGQGVYVTDTANRESSGFLQSSKIRYNTLEPKHFKQMYLRAQPILDGSIAITAYDPGGGVTSIITYGVGSTFGQPTFINQEGNQQEWLTFQFTLIRGVPGVQGTNYTPVFGGYQLRSLPGVNRQLQFTIPLQCFDRELDKFGVTGGYDGFAYSRIQALLQVVQSGNVIPLQDLNYNQTYLVVVDDFHFEQQANPAPKNATSANQTDSNALGGYLSLVCRSVQ